MSAPAGEHRTRAAGESSNSVAAGRIGRAHGLDGSFYVTGPRPRLLALGTTLSVAGRTARVLRRAGTDEHPIVRLEGIESRDAVESARGLELTVELAEAPALGEQEWWASELEGCEVLDGERHLGVVAGLVELPSCEALEVRLARSSASAGKERGGELLVPMVRDAIRKVDVANKRIDIDVDFLGDLL
jgi:16S rRNA processing protein RimM